jgi:hypothetical protein
MSHRLYIAVSGSTLPTYWAWPLHRPTDLVVYWANSTCRYSGISAKGNIGRHILGFATLRNPRIECGSDLWFKNSFLHGRTSDRDSNEKGGGGGACPLFSLLLEFRGSIIASVSVTFLSSYMGTRSGWSRAARPRGRSSSPGGGKNFHFSTASRPALGSTQPPILWVTGALSPGIKRQGHEVNHSPPTNA